MGLDLCSLKHPQPIVVQCFLVMIRSYFLRKLAAAEACIQSQAERINSFDILFDYLAEKDPALAAILRRGSSTQIGQANPNEPPVSTAPEPQVANEETAAAALANLATGSSPPSTVF